MLLSSPHFDHILHALQQFELTPWKMVGFAGTLLFTSRWFVQLYY
ncbi:lipid A biosynthesis acyltransferase, partial [Burkholderia multivorans]